MPQTNPHCVALSRRSENLIKFGPNGYNDCWTDWWIHRDFCVFLTLFSKLLLQVSPTVWVGEIERYSPPNSNFIQCISFLLKEQNLTEYISTMNTLLSRYSTGCMNVSLYSVCISFALFVCFIVLCVYLSLLRLSHWIHFLRFLPLSLSLSPDLSLSLSEC